MPKFQVGDIVKIVSLDKEDFSEKFRVGKRMRIRGVEQRGLKFVYFFEGVNLIGLWEHQIEKVEGAQMRKQDLQPFMLVEYRNGQTRLVAIFGKDVPMLVGPTGNYMHLHGYTDRLARSDYTLSDLDIMKVYSRSLKEEDTLSFDPSTRELLWERNKPVEELTMEQLIKRLGYEVKIVK